MRYWSPCIPSRTTVVDEGRRARVVMEVCVLVYESPLRIQSRCRFPALIGVYCSLRDICILLTRVQFQNGSSARVCKGIIQLNSTISR
ncbi:hypothetical protein TNCT_398641 [Trichonephila clavata]|uniref:Uncharacterized protein n=1 Tax=Trichonephila clavata TaxID=2740835 RepID=A0A8X6FVJ0_TRICU|nr:hypothetical protein TNCT_398641 [Trichonephila clavata]